MPGIVSGSLISPSGVKTLSIKGCVSTPTVLSGKDIIFNASKFAICRIRSVIKGFPFISSETLFKTLIGISTTLSPKPIRLLKASAV